ncbi:hypothetical protein WMY93_017628 [Mugilogobius chulae]|uniref:Transcription regulator Myc N-terminal domain-containing protein n=1 Tax=Mugilogobius chulae TaxID=88201 RepID=A0AAW0P0B2_9GOBI
MSTLLWCIPDPQAPHLTISHICYYNNKRQCTLCGISGEQGVLQTSLHVLVDSDVLDFIYLNSIMELDCYQHYFLDDLDTEEDFYKSTAPSEDIWKKFELLPTPPMSPTRTFSGAALHFPLGDKLSWSSKFLGHEDECLPSSRHELCANLSSIIIRDCMWSSFSASKQLEKVSGKAAVAAVNTSVCALPQISVRTAKAQCVSAATDCVDPAAVLTIPPANSCRKPASSGSESRSESLVRNQVVMP